LSSAPLTRHFQDVLLDQLSERSSVLDLPWAQKVIECAAVFQVCALDAPIEGATSLATHLSDDFIESFPTHPEPPAGTTPVAVPWRRRPGHQTV